MTLDHSRIGVALRALRKLRALTQRELAEKAGSTANTVARRERGELNFTVAMLDALAKALDVPAATFTVMGTVINKTDDAGQQVLTAIQSMIDTTIEFEQRGGTGAG